MLQLINAFVDICLLRRGPQDLPTSTTLTALCLLLYALLVATAEVVTGESERAVPWAAISLGGVILVISALLRLRNVAERTRQTLTALAGCGFLLGLAQLPLFAALPAEGEPAGALLPLAFLVSLVLFFWSFAVEGHILRHALSVSFPAGVLVSVVLYALFRGLYWALYPAVA